MVSQCSKPEALLLAWSFDMSFLAQPSCVLVDSTDSKFSLSCWHCLLESAVGEGYLGDTSPVIRNHRGICLHFRLVSRLYTGKS